MPEQLLELFCSQVSLLAEPRYVRRDVRLCPALSRIQFLGKIQDSAQPLLVVKLHLEARECSFRQPPHVNQGSEIVQHALRCSFRNEGLAQDVAASLV